MSDGALIPCDSAAVDVVIAGGNVDSFNGSDCTAKSVLVQGTLSVVVSYVVWHSSGK